MDVADLAGQIVEFTRRNSEWVALVVFALGFLEFLPFVWIALVGVAALVGPSEPLRLWLVVLAAVLGGAAGDTFLYWLGLRRQRLAGAMWPLRNHPRILEKSTKFFERWGVWAVFLGRFSGPVRLGVPIVAGVARMPWLNFQLATLAAAAAWGIVFLLPGAWGADWLAQQFN